MYELVFNFNLMFFYLWIRLYYKSKGVMDFV